MSILYKYIDKYNQKRKTNIQLKKCNNVYLSYTREYHKITVGI